MNFEITDYDLSSAHESVRVEIDHDRNVTIKCADLFDFLAQTHAPGEVWINDPENGYITIAESGTRGTTYEYARFFKVYHNEINDFFGRYALALGNKVEALSAAA